MKIKYILFFLLIVTFRATAQKGDYIPLLDTNKLWIVAMRLEFGELQITEYHIGDRIVYNDTVYYELYDEVSTNPNYMREDTVEKKIYVDCYDLPDPCEDVLLYDFSLDTGDSIYFDSGYLYVDSVNYIDDKYRTIYLGEPNWEGQLIWAEGIGSLAGILQTQCTPGLQGMGQTELNCLYLNDQLIYKSDFATIYGCRFEFLNVDSITKEELHIFPNPVSGQITVKFEHAHPQMMTVELIDLYGKVVQITRSDESTFQVPTFDLLPGVYILIISDQRSIVYRNKIIIKR
jgi:hypothetical protein